MKKKIITYFLTVSILISAIFFAGGCQSSCAKNKNLTTYDITATLDGNTLTATQTVDFYNGYDTTFTELKFNLFGNAFRKGAKYNPIANEHLSQAYYDGQNFGGMEILSVSSNETPLNFNVGGQDLTLLTVELSKEVFPNERYLLTINYTLNLAKVVARTGVNKSTINLGNFYPILCAYDTGVGFYECLYYAIGDPFYSDCANYNVTLSADSEYVFAHSGALSKEEINGNVKTVEFSLQNARSVAVVLSKKFNVEKRLVDGVEISYYHYNDANPKLSLDTAEKSIRYFNQTFGAYPYSTYSVVETAFVQGGMEYPALVMISDNLEEKAYQEVIVHETAHQWWQTAVGNNEIEYGFLDEGLAEYSVVLFYENHPEYGYTRQTLIDSSNKSYKVFCSVYDQIFGNLNTKMLRPLNEFSGEFEYVNMAYIKPCIMYDTLRTTVGEQTFFSALKKYYEKYKFINATPYDLVGTFEKVGADTNGYFESFFSGKAIL